MHCETFEKRGEKLGDVLLLPPWGMLNASTQAAAGTVSERRPQDGQGSRMSSSTKKANK